MSGGPGVGAYTYPVSLQSCPLTLVTQGINVFRLGVVLRHGKKQPEDLQQGETQPRPIDDHSNATHNDHLIASSTLGLAGKHGEVAWLKHTLLSTLCWYTHVAALPVVPQTPVP
jgi:hypothetical protein